MPFSVMKIAKAVSANMQNDNTMLTLTIIGAIDYNCRQAYKVEGPQAAIAQRLTGE